MMINKQLSPRYHRLIVLFVYLNPSIRFTTPIFPHTIYNNVTLMMAVYSYAAKYPQNVHLVTPAIRMHLWKLITEPYSRSSSRPYAIEQRLLTTDDCLNKYVETITKNEAQQIVKVGSKYYANPPQRKLSDVQYKRYERFLSVIILREYVDRYEAEDWMHIILRSNCYEEYSHVLDRFNNVETPPPHPWEVSDATSVSNHLDALHNNGNIVAISVDFETEDISIYPFMHIVGVSVGTLTIDNVTSNFYVPMQYLSNGSNNPYDPTIRHLINSLCALSFHYPLVAHNAVFEYNCFAAILNKRHDESVDVQFVDTMILAHHLDIPKGLKAAVKKVLNVTMTTFDEMLGNRSITIVPVHQIAQYATADTHYTLALYNHLAGGLDSENACYITDIDLIPIVSEIERHGLAIDTQWLNNWRTTLDHELKAVIQQMQHLLCSTLLLESDDEYITGLNFSSPAQVSHLLFNVLNLTPQRKTTTGYSTDDKTLHEIYEQSEFIPLLLEYRELAKQLSTYAEGFITRIRSYSYHTIRNQLAIGDNAHPLMFVDSVIPTIHPHYNIVGTGTGRMSSNNPNGQNIPLKAREMVIPYPGKVLVAADYSQIELRLAASMSQDPVLLEAFKHSSPHMVTFEHVFGLTDKHNHPMEYRLAKNINFSSIYGAGPLRLVEYAREGGTRMTLNEAIALLQAHKQLYPTLFHWMDQQKQIIATNNGKAMTVQGAVRYYRDINSLDNGRRAEAERQAINMMIQGSAGYITKMAMVLWYEGGFDKLYGPIIAQVHDEIVIEVDNKDDLPKSALESLMVVMKAVGTKYLTGVVCEVEGNIGPNWKTLK